MEKKRKSTWFKILLLILIMGMILGFYRESSSEEEVDLIKGQLSKLQESKITQAYYDYTSKDFQEVNSLIEFRHFIEFYHVLSDNKLFIYEGKELKDDIAIVQGKLISKTSDEMNVEYLLIKEEGAWKIQGIRIMDDASKESNTTFLPSEELEDEFLAEEESSQKQEINTTDIAKITAGDQTDQNGVVVTPRTALDSSLNLLFVNVAIENGVQGTLITLFLSHLDSSTSAPPLSTVLDKDGNSTVVFSYAAPRGGWPIGYYSLKVTTSSGKEKIEKIQIRKGEKEFY